MPRNWGNSPPFTFSTCCLDKKALHCFEKYLSLDFRAKLPCPTLVPPRKCWEAQARAGSGEQCLNVMLLTGSAWATALELAFVGSGQSLVLVPAARLSKYLQLRTCSQSRHVHITDACLYLEHGPHCLDQSISSTQTCRVDCQGGLRTMPDLLSSAYSLPCFIFILDSNEC